jgi:hypothetical protein
MRKTHKSYSRNQRKSFAAKPLSVALPRTRSGAMQLKHKVVIQAPHGAFFVGFGEGWISTSFSRSNGNAIAETMRKAHKS